MSEEDEYGWDLEEKYDYAFDRLESLMKYGNLRKDEEIQAFIACALFGIANELSAKNKHTKDDYHITKKQRIRRSPHIPTAIRHEVFKKDNYRCKECGRTSKEVVIEVDHILPVSQGGTDELDNLQTLCLPCNRAKQDRMFKTEMKKLESETQLTNDGVDD